MNVARPPRRIGEEQMPTGTPSRGPGHNPCPNDHGNAEHWYEDTYGKEFRLECDCDCEYCREY